MDRIFQTGIFALPMILAATLSGCGEMSYDTDSSEVIFAEGVYSMAATEIPDSLLRAYYIKPSVQLPSVRVPISDPPVLPRGYNRIDWVFEGTLKPRPPEDLANVIAKREMISAYMDSLSDSDRLALETRIIAQRKAERRSLALQRGEVFDERDDISVMIFPNRQIWRKKVPRGYVPNLSKFPSNRGIADADTNRIVLQSFGDGLTLVSAWNGNKMNSYPIRAQGCIASQASATTCSCSGTKISPRLVITAGHCLTDGEEEWIDDGLADVWIPGVDGAGNAKDSKLSQGINGYKALYAASVHSYWFDYEWNNYDMGTFILNDTKANCDLGWFGYDHENGLTGDRVNLWAVPGPTQSCSDSPFGNGYCYGSIYRDSGDVITAGSHSFRYDITVKKGMSGGGVYKYNESDDERTVIGVNIQKTPNYGRACKINSGKLGMLNDIKSDYPGTACLPIPCIPGTWGCWP